jgi:hypothetical protein
MDVHFKIQTTKKGSSQLRESSKGLPWLARRLNQKLSVDGKQMIVPVDLRHPLGNHVLVNHDWSQEDKDSFQKDGQLSLSASLGSKWVKDTTPNAVVLRFIEGHALPADSSGNGKTHEISGSYLTPQYEGKKQVLWIVSTMTPKMHRDLPKSSDADYYYTSSTGFIKASAPDCYYIIPSGFTKASTLDRQPKSKDPVNNYMTPSVHATPGVAKEPLCRAGALFADDKFDPLHHIVHIDKFPELFAELFDAASGPEISIPSTSTAAPSSGMFRKEDYLTLQREVHQASWDFGLSFREY